MKCHSLNEISKIGRASCSLNRPRWVTRRERLQRFAGLLEQSDAPVQLFARIEYMSDDQWNALRDDGSPLALAFADHGLREQGLRSDKVGDASAFFRLSRSDMHRLVCDCHYPRNTTSKMIAREARAIANKRTVGEIWDRVRLRLVARRGGLAAF